MVLRDDVPTEQGHAPYCVTNRVHSVIGMITTTRTGARGLSASPLIPTVGILLGPALIAAGSALDPSGTAPPVGAYLARVAEARSLYLVAGLLMLLGMAALVVTALTLHRLVPVLGGGGLLRAGAIALGVWGIFGACGVTAGFTAGWVGADLPGGSPTSLVESVFLGVTRSPWGTVGAILGGAGWALGTAVTGLALIRIRAHRWAGVAVVASLLAALAVGMAGSDVHRLMALPFAILAFGLASPVVRSLGERDPARASRSLPVVDVLD